MSAKYVPGSLAPSHGLAPGWIGQFLREAVPALSIFLLLLTALLPMRLPVNWAAGGLWPLLGLFYWSLVQPRLVPVMLVFTGGILSDLAFGMALGCHALVFLLVHLVLTTQRRFLVGQGFWLVWPAFTLSVVCAYSMIFLLQHAVTATGFAWDDWRSGWPAIVAVILAFPVLLPVLHGVQRLLSLQKI